MHDKPDKPLIQWTMFIEKPDRTITADVREVLDVMRLHALRPHLGSSWGFVEQRRYKAPSVLSALRPRDISYFICVNAPLTHTLTGTQVESIEQGMQIIEWVIHEQLNQGESK